jgi:hypothetical protein
MEVFYFRGELNYDIPCDPAGIRTLNPHIKSVMLYQLSYEIINYFFLGYDFILRDGEGLSYLSITYYTYTFVTPPGIKPGTLELEIPRSVQLSYGAILLLQR